MVKFELIGQSGGVWTGVFAATHPMDIRAIEEFSSRSRGTVFEITEKQFEAREMVIPEPIFDLKDFTLEPIIYHDPRPQMVSKRPNRIIHCVERHEQKTPDAYRRVMNAVNSWVTLYLTGDVLPCHYWNYKRDSGGIGDMRKLPYLKDVLRAGIDASKNPDDIIMLTNDDSILHPDAGNAVFAHLKKVPAVCSGRINFEFGTLPDFTRRYDDNLYHKDIGRDAFAFRKDWLEANFDFIPDFLLGELEWDLILMAMLRKKLAKKKTTLVQRTKREPITELPLGMVMHEQHEKVWQERRMVSNPSKKHNVRLMGEWCEKEEMDELITIRQKDLE